jgi:hypothetical protein
MSPEVGGKEGALGDKLQLPFPGERQAGFDQVRTQPLPSKRLGYARVRKRDRVRISLILGECNLIADPNFQTILSCIVADRIARVWYANQASAALSSAHYRRFPFRVRDNATLQQ